MGDRTLTVQALISLTEDKILEGLDAALVAERQAVVDYHAHAQVCDQPKIREALETLRDVEREHARRLLARIHTLGSSPTSDEAAPQPTGDTLADWLAHDLRGEQWAIVEYARLVAGIMDDDETVELMTELLLDEIRHAGWLKATLRKMLT